MVLVLVALGFILIVGGIICFIGSDSPFPGTIMSILIGVILIMIAAAAEEKYGPTAMDVYQGKTTLRITYEDGIPIDSVVVFKKNKD